jgi:hypothetical protein
VLLALILWWIFGCTTLTEAEREERLWKIGIDAENWQMCEQVYKELGKPTYHLDHTHPTTKRAAQRVPTTANGWWDLKSDLSVNRCREILGDYYIKY